MRSPFTLLLLSPVWALPLPYRMFSSGYTDVNVLQHDIESAYTKFEVAPGFQDALTSPLVFELQVDPSPDLLTSSILLNTQSLDITWSRPESPVSPTVLPKTQHLVVPDRLGFSHSLQLSISGEVTSFTGVSGPVQSLNFHFDAVDGSNTALSFTIVVQATGSRRLLKLLPAVASDIVHFDHMKESLMLDPKSHHIYIDEPVGYSDVAYDIDSEIEALLLLETEASKLQASITTKKEAIAKCLKGHRDEVTLKHLLSQCDGLVCAARVIAQRLCDKMGILTVPKHGYLNVQDQYRPIPISSHDEKEKPLNETKIPVISEKHSDFMHTESLHPAAAIQSIRIVYPQNVLLKVLGVIATAIGLSALFSFIRRKCMSARRLVERAADAEERRNARAYRRAARRAEMRRRWDAFVSAVSCFGSESEPRIEDYEEKRALILQDAFLEQDEEAAEKADIMEAEIRELRHAHEIVASLVRVDDNRYDLITPVHDPPPPMVPLPYTPVSRSRASSATLPSYTSEILPEYASRYTRTEAASSSSSLRSNSMIADSVEQYTAATSSEDGTGSTSRTRGPESSLGSRRSRYTPTSSVVETSPRPSGETLRTICRFSRDTTGTSL